MSNELVQTGFFDLELDTPQKTWHIGLEDRLQDTLRQRAAKIKAVVAQANFIIGEELATAQKELTYKNGGFVKWLEEEVGIDNQRAYEFIQIWEHYKMFPLSGNISSLGKKVLLAGAREDVPESAREEIVTRHEAGEKITQTTADDIIEKHKAELEEVERQKKELQEQFDLFKDQAKKDLEAERAQNKRNLEAKENELKLTQENKKLQEDKVKSLEADNKKIKEEKTQVVKEDTEETKATLEAREKEIKEAKTKLEELERAEKQLKADKKTLSDEATKLADELKKLQEDNKDRLRQERYEQKVKEQCSKSNETIQKAIMQYVGQLPTPLASQVYTFDEWGQLDQTDKLLDYCKEAIARTRQEQYNSRLIDANPSNDLVVYESQEPHFIDANPIEQDSNPPDLFSYRTGPTIGIPPEHQDLFGRYQQAVLNFPENELVFGQLLWSAPSYGYTNQMMGREKHIQFTKELLSSEVDRRIKAAIEAMKQTLGIWEEVKA